MTTIYIAGPMSGIEDFNYPAFHEAEEVILSDHPDVTVINPARNFDGRQDLPWENYLAKAESQVAQADTVVLLPGWETSEGVKRELDVAEANDIRVVDYLAYTGLPFGPLGDPDNSAVADGQPEILDEPRLPQPVERDRTDLIEGHDADPSDFCDDYACTWCHTPGPKAEGSRIIDEAWEMVVEGARQSSYGHPDQDFKTTGRMWGALLDNWLKSEGYALCLSGGPVDGPRETDLPNVDPEVVALMLACVKMSRQTHAPKHDNLVDLVGYTICADRIVREY